MPKYLAIWDSDTGKTDLVNTAVYPNYAYAVVYNDRCVAVEFHEETAGEVRDKIAIAIPDPENIHIDQATFTYTDLTKAMFERIVCLTQIPSMQEMSS